MSRITVLVVDDEALIRLGMVDYLLEIGLDPIEAESADAAIAILEARNDIQIVFTDIQMPGTMDGLQLARYVRERWPPTAIVICRERNSSARMSCQRTATGLRNPSMQKPWRRL